MIWVIQNNLYKEDAINELIDILARNDIEYHLVKVIPFNGGIEPELDFLPDDNVIVIGSVSLVNHARQKGWKPGSWLNENFDYKVYIEHQQWCMLNRANGGKYIVPFKDVPLFFEDFKGSSTKIFMRPSKDDKSFSGTVFSKASFMEWYRQIIKGDSMWSVTEDTEIVMDEVIDIYNEYRFVVVRGKVITGSKYKSGKYVIYNTDIPDLIMDHAKEFAARWTPAEVCVMDLAETPDGIYIVEFNNFNSVGWYKCDVSKIVQTIETLT
jgi:hypothetical protein